MKKNENKLDLQGGIILLVVCTFFAGSIFLVYRWFTNLDSSSKYSEEYWTNIKLEEQYRKAGLKAEADYLKEYRRKYLMD